MPRELHELAGNEYMAEHFTLDSEAVGGIGKTITLFETEVFTVTLYVTVVPPHCAVVGVWSISLNIIVSGVIPSTNLFAIHLDDNKMDSGTLLGKIKSEILDDLISKTSKSVKKS